MKTHLLPSVLALLCATSAMAADYFIVVPVKGRTAAAPVQDIQVSLNAYTLPSALEGSAYSFDLKPLLTVTGDNAYTGAGVTWNVVSNTLPSGLYLTADGYIVGTPTAAGTGSITVRATYKGQSDSANYTLAADTPSRSLELSPAISGKTVWNLDVDGPLVLSTPGVYNIRPKFDLTASVKMWAGGGGGGQPYPGNESYTRGAGAGAAKGDVSLSKGASYTVVVGSPGALLSPGPFGFGGAGSNGNYNLRGGGGGGLSGLFLGDTVAQSSSSNALLVAGGGGGGGSSAWGGTQACVATAGGGSSVLNVGSVYGGGTVYIPAPTYAQAAPGASGMKGGSSVTTIYDGNGGGGGGYQGGGAGMNTGQGCQGGTGGLGYVAPTVLNGATYSGGQTLSTFATPALSADPDRGAAGAGGAPSSQGTGGKVILR